MVIITFHAVQQNELCNEWQCFLGQARIHRRSGST